MLQDEQKLMYILFQGLFLSHYLDLRERNFKIIVPYSSLPPNFDY